MWILTNPAIPANSVLDVIGKVFRTLQGTNWRMGLIGPLEVGTWVPLKSPRNISVSMIP